MDKDFYMNDFERLLKDKAEEYKMYPSESVWTNIFNKLHPGRKWGIIGSSVLLLLFTASVLVLRSNNKNTVTQKETVNNARPVAAETKVTVQNDLVFSDVNKFAGANAASISVSAPLKKHSREISFTQGGNLLNFTDQSAVKQNDFTGEKNTNTPVSVNTWFIPTEEAIAENADYTSDEMFLNYIAATEKIRSNRNNNSFFNAAGYPGLSNKTAKKGAGKFEWQLYFTPSVSYRALLNNNDPSVRSFAYSSYIPGNIDKSVQHTPALGFEVGNAFLYSLNKSLKIKAGVQFNYSKYNIKAFSSYPELATIRLASSSFQTQDITVPSNYKTYGSLYNATTIASQNTAISFPIGIDYTIAGNGILSWAVAGTLQPTLILNNKAYIVTNDLKNYVRNADVFRNFVMNSSFETYLKFEKGNGVALQIGPQLRYQVNSSYTQKYAISEHLIEYGLKVGIIKRLSK